MAAATCRFRSEGTLGRRSLLRFPSSPAARWRAPSPTSPRPAQQKALGFPGALVEDWHDKAIARLGELVNNSRALRVYLDSCVKCGACTDKCHYFLGTGDPKNMPVARQNLLRKVYRRHFTLAGKYLPWLVGAEDLTKEVLDDWYSYFHQCSQCRRCSVYCPYGIDTAEISMAARDIMDTIGLGQKYCNEIIGKVFTIGNNLGLPPKALKATLAGLEEEIEEETGVAGAPAAGREGRRHPAGHAERRFLRLAAHGRPDRLRQGLPRSRRQLDAQLASPPRRRISACSSARYDNMQKVAHAHPQGGRRARRQAPRLRRVRPRLARRLQFSQHARRPVRFPRPRTIPSRSTSANSPTT